MVKEMRDHRPPARTQQVLQGGGGGGGQPGARGQGRGWKGEAKGGPLLPKLNPALLEKRAEGREQKPLGKTPQRTCERAARLGSIFQRQLP